MPNLKELSLETDGKFVATGTRVAVGSKVLKAKHKWSSGTNSFSLEGIIPKWSFTYDHPSRDVSIEHKKAIKLGTLTIKQRIPNKKFYLVPSPEFKLAANPINAPKNKLRDELELSYDFQRRVGKVEEELIYNNKYKAKVSVDTLTGAKNAQLALTAKLGKPWATSVGITASRTLGPVLNYESEVGKGALRTKADLALKTRTAKVELSPKPFRKVRLTLTASARADKLRVPSFLLGAKYEP